MTPWKSERLMRSAAVLTGLLCIVGCGVGHEDASSRSGLDSDAVKALAESALQRGRELESAGRVDAALDLYEQRSREISEGLPRGADARAILVEALRAAGRADDRREAIRILARGLNRAISAAR